MPKNRNESFNSNLKNSYGASLNYDPNKIKINCGDAFNNYVDNHTVVLSDLIKTINKDDKKVSKLTKKLHDKLENRNNDLVFTQSLTALNTRIALAFEIAPKTVEIKNTFNDGIKLIEQKYKLADEKLGALSLLQDEALPQFKEQHEADSRKLKAFFSEPANIAEIKATFDLNDNEFKSMQAGALALLAEKQKTDINNFQKEIENNIRALQEEINKERARIALLEQLRNEKEKDVDALIREQPPEQPVAMQLGANLPNLGEAKYKNVKADSCIKLITGKTINYDGDAFSVDTSDRSDDAIIKDLTKICSSVRTKKDSITFEIGFSEYNEDDKNQDPGKKTKAYHQAHLAFITAVEKGFDPNKINISINGKMIVGNVNGKVPSLDERKQQQNTLFSGCSQDLDNARHLYAKNNDAAFNENRKNQITLKSDINQMRAQAQQPQQQQQPIGLPP